MRRKVAAPARPPTERKAPSATPSASATSKQTNTPSSQHKHAAVNSRLPKQLSSPRHSMWLDVLLTLFLLFGSSVEQSGVLSTVAGKAVLVVCFAALAVKLLRFKRWNDETSHALRFFASFAVLLLWLAFENAAIFFVSATDLKRDTPTPPLQDNLLNMFLAARARLSPSNASLLDLSLRHEWIGIKEKLLCLVALGFAAVFDAVPFSGFAMARRAVVTITHARVIRTVAFLLTVIPSPRPGPPTCYQRRFHSASDAWPDLLRTAFSKIRAGGGCNDLILSGHGVIYAACACALSEFAPGAASALLWLACARSALRATVGGHHYSVDMFLAYTVTWLFWRANAGVCSAADRLKPRPAGAPPDPKGPLQWVLTAAVGVVLLSLGIIVIVGGA